MLADDGPDNRDLLSYYLEQAGAEVVLADNGRVACDREAEARAAGRPVDLVLLDMQMPELDGYGAAAKLRARGFAGPVVALTAHAMADDRERCLRAGCTDYLSKPVDRHRLVETVARHLPGLALRVGAGAGPGAAEADPTPTAVPVGGAAVGQAPTAEAVPEAEVGGTATGRLALPPTVDEGVRRFFPKFLERVAELVPQLEAGLREQRLEELANLAHQIKGTAGLYSLHPLTAAAGRAEALARECDPAATAGLAALAGEVEELVRLVRSIDGYDATKEAPSAGSGD
jgi:CheY-like chemotaxis protein/HPt (histidine-containing phosphotransfer) domain-containing protein